VLSGIKNECVRGMGLLRWTPGAGALLLDVYLGATAELGPEQHVFSTVAAMPLYFHTGGFAPGTTYYWRVDTTTVDGTVVEGDVWMFMTKALTAYYPTPVDGGSATSLTPDLTWLPGKEAFEHHVYFSANEAAVADRTEEAEIGIWKDPNYAPDALQPISTYYWCVDEIKADGSEVAGDVWSFTTILPIDDFESYTNEVGQRVFEVWVDGIGFSLPEPGNPGNGTGAAVGHDVWAAGTPYTLIMEQNVVHSGVQSMPLYYDNGASPYCSEAERTWVVRQDWKTSGLDALTLHVQGLARDFEIFTGTPVIDGEVDEIWADVTPFPVTTNIDGTEPSGPADASGQLRRRRQHQGRAGVDRQCPPVHFRLDDDGHTGDQHESHGRRARASRYGHGLAARDQAPVAVVDGYGCAGRPGRRQTAQGPPILMISG